MAPPRATTDATGLSPAVVWRSSHFASFSPPRCWGSSPSGRSHNPRHATPARLARDGFRQRPVSLATTPGVVLFPPATEMFQFAGFPRAGRTPARVAPIERRVAPFGHGGISVSVPLPHPIAAVARPSSAGRAEASSDRASCLAWSPGSSAARARHVRCGPRRNRGSRLWPPCILEMNGAHPT
jgi:hypothetical protein